MRLYNNPLVSVRPKEALVASAAGALPAAAGSQLSGTGAEGTNERSTPTGAAESKAGGAKTLEKCAGSLPAASSAAAATAGEVATKVAGHRESEVNGERKRAFAGEEAAEMSSVAARRKQVRQATV
jgi:hypothetical protein